jgi:hypothetical protein
MRFDEFSRDDWVIAGVALLLIIDLLFLPWFSISATVLGIHVSATTTATGSLDGWTAVIAVLACAAIIADIAIERLSPGTTVPNLGGSRTQTRFVLACVAAGFVALKFLLHIHFSDFGFAFYAAVVLCVVLVLAARRANAGGAIYRPGIR